MFNMPTCHAKVVIIYMSHGGPFVAPLEFPVEPAIIETSTFQHGQDRVRPAFSGRNVLMLKERTV